MLGHSGKYIQVELFVRVAARLQKMAADPRNSPLEGSKNDSKGSPQHTRDGVEGFRIPHFFISCVLMLFMFPFYRGLFFSSPQSFFK